MSGLAALGVAALLATVPCPRAQEHEARLRAAQGADEVDATLAALSREAGGMPFAPEPGLSPEARARVAGERLRAACALEAAAVVPPDGGAARLEALYARPELAGARGGGRNVLAELVRRVLEFLSGLGEDTRARSFSEATRTVTLGLAGLVAVWGVWRLVRARRRGGRERSARPTAPGTAAGVVLQAPEAHLARARAALEVDARAALREALLALLSALERRRLSRPDRVRTNRELARELPARGAPPEVAAEVARLVEWYDARFYSLAPVGPADARRFVDEVAALEARLPVGVGT